MNIEEAILDIQVSLKKAQDKMNDLRGIETQLSRICSGTMPKQMRAETKKLKDIQSALEKDDSWFISQLATIADTKDPIQSMLNLATVVAKLDDAGRRIDVRISKLTNRISASGPEESQTAIQLKSNLVETRKTIDTRISATLNRFFSVRLYAITAILKLTEKLCNLWKDGSTELRTAALKSSASQAIYSLGEWEKVAVQGAFKMGSSSGKGGIKI